MLRYAVTIFLSAFLLFQVQPLISKYILPWFGGSPAVWTVCLLFFQVLLLGGYTYAHIVHTRLAQRRQVVLHLVLMGLALVLLLVAMPPSARWKPHGGADPTWRILLLLAASIGLPYFILSTTGPLLQAWFSRTHPGRSPYRLYSLSNVGSLLALLSFPFVVEPRLTSTVQCWAWAAGFAAFVVCCAWAALRTLGVREGEGGAALAPVGVPGAVPDRAPGVVARLLWLGLAACASVLLLGTTHKICQDVAVVPFLWVLPLSLYLLSFIICFDNERWYFRPVFWPLFLLAIVAVIWLMFRGVNASVAKLVEDLDDLYRTLGLNETWLLGTRSLKEMWPFKYWAEVGASIQTQVVGYAFGLFVCCMVCHGELVRLKPSPRYLTSFYLMVALGGAMGGIFVGLIAPRIFRIYLEFNIGLGACLVLALAAVWYGSRGYRYLGWWWRRRVPLPDEALGLPEVRTAFTAMKWVARLGLPLSLLALAVLGEAMRREANHVIGEAKELTRSFYGVLTVTEYSKDDPELRHYSLQNGRISHGWQLTSEDGKLRPVSYFGEKSGVGMTFHHYPRNGHGLRVGVLGLGVGTFAAYGKKGDHVTFYEINPDVEKVARTWFSYLSDSEDRGVEVDVRLGDGRLTLEREEPQKFDVLALDAFSSDAVPVHLLTREAFQIYLRHMKDEGVILVNTTNRYVDLYPIACKLAEHFKLRTALIESYSDAAHSLSYCTWMLLSRNGKLLDSGPIRRATKAGLRAGDILLEANNEKVGDLESFRRIAAGASVGSTLRVKVLRSQEEQLYDATLAEGPPDVEPGGREAAARVFSPRLGMTVTVEELTPERAKEIGREAKEALVVGDVEEDGPAARASQVPRPVRLWTDDFSNLYQILRWK